MTKSITDHANMVPITLRIPTELVAWIDEQCRLNASSRNSEIVRAVREKVSRHTAMDDLAKAERSADYKTPLYAR